jgi:predicted DCC family thiol-disulfide oxidoreductase YuxK
MDFQADKWYIIYDGYCRLCTWWVRLLIKYDRKDQFRFVPNHLLKKDQLFASISSFETAVVVYYSGKYYQSSDAILEIVTQLDYPWKAFRHLRFLPRKIREAIYFWIARNRKSFFGEFDTCPIVPIEHRHKFPD